MKIRSRMIVLMSVTVWLIGSGVTTAGAEETNATSFGVFAGGIGPTCFPGIGCGNTQAIGVWGGGGPVCFPGIGCGNTQTIAAWQDGGGPVCFPGIGCGNGQSIGQSIVVFKGGIGPTCWPGLPCA